MAVQVVDLSTGRFSNHKSSLPQGARLSLLRLKQYCIGLYITVRMHWWTIIHFKPRCSTANRHSLVPWLDQLSSKWDCGFDSGLTKYRTLEGNAATVFFGFSKLFLMQLDLLIDYCICLVLFFYISCVRVCMSEFYKSCGRSSLIFLCEGCMFSPAVSQFSLQSAHLKGADISTVPIHQKLKDSLMTHFNCALLFSRFELCIACTLRAL